MLQTIPDILSRVVEHKRGELSGRTTSRPALEKRAAERIKDKRDFAAALRTRKPAVIAEIKRASPSKGLLCANFDPATIAAQYQAGGAAALSVLTDERFFQGSMSHLESARSAVELPVLRKDFTIDEFHIVEAAAHGADAVLLIAAILSAAEMRGYRELAASLGMAAIVEVHSDHELDAALESGAEIIGVNNRDLHSFEVTVETSLRLAGKIPEGVVKVSESGISSGDDVRRLVEAGYNAVLVGEHLMRSADPAAALRSLLS